MGLTLGGLTFAPPPATPTHAAARLMNRLPRNCDVVS